MSLSRAPLEDGEIRRRLAADLPSWRAAGGGGERLWLEREVSFSGFRAAFAFMTEVALAAEKLDHHPNWSNVYNRVSIRLSTHDAGGVTEFDFALAKAVEEAVHARSAT
jgi:4a-hydroxytetrahydrobiopterin dehydratase